MLLATLVGVFVACLVALLVGPLTGHQAMAALAALMPWLLLWTVKLLMRLRLCWFGLGWLERLFYLGVFVRGVLRAVGGGLEKWFQVNVVNQSLSRILPCLILDKL